MMCVCDMAKKKVLLTTLVANNLIIDLRAKMFLPNVFFFVYVALSVCLSETEKVDVYFWTYRCVLHRKILSVDL